MSAIVDETSCNIETASAFSHPKKLHQVFGRLEK